MVRKQKRDDALAELLSAAPPKALSDLILQLSTTRPDVRRECFEYLKKHVPLSQQQKNMSEGEAALSLWSELAPDLDELDEYGGGYYGMVDHVSSLLYEIKKKLSGKQVEAGYRRELTDLALPYIKSGNAGLDDDLQDVAYAACYETTELRSLAEAFEAMDDVWKTGLARQIYRKIGDRQKYLELRSQAMTYGSDYYDLATFYWESGEKAQALQVAEEGLQKARGRMDELRLFLAKRAQESGNRERYLELRFAHATDHLTLEEYKTFKKICTASEWREFEAKVLERLKQTRVTEQLRIRMYRKEYKEALSVLSKERYPTSDWEDGYQLRAAKKLESRFPEEILKYYLSGLGNLKANAVRKEYARKATVMAKVHHMLVDVLRDEKRWRMFALPVKQANLKRPAFQDEFSKAVPDWLELE